MENTDECEGSLTKYQVDVQGNLESPDSNT